MNQQLPTFLSRVLVATYPAPAARGGLTATGEHHPAGILGDYYTPQELEWMRRLALIP